MKAAAPFCVSLVAPKPNPMEKQITAVALVLSIAGLGYLKAQQLDRMEAQAELDAKTQETDAKIAQADAKATEERERAERLQHQVEAFDQSAASAVGSATNERKARVEAELQRDRVGVQPPPWPCARWSRSPPRMRRIDQTPQPGVGAVPRARAPPSPWRPPARSWHPSPAS